MAGNKSIGENYSFSGVHHIFDQHKSAGVVVITTAYCISNSLSIVQTNPF